jgi:hypothetical protein
MTGSTSTYTATVKNNGPQPVLDGQNLIHTSYCSLVEPLYAEQFLFHWPNRPDHWHCRHRSCFSFRRATTDLRRGLPLFSRARRMSWRCLGMQDRRRFSTTTSPRRC